jgi:hypothetical protein
VKSVNVKSKGTLCKASTIFDMKPLHKHINYPLRHSGLDPESSSLNAFWIPAFASMTAFVMFCNGLDIRYSIFGKGTLNCFVAKGI